MAFFRSVYVPPAELAAAPAPRAEHPDGGRIIRTAQDLQEVLAGGAGTASGVAVNANNAMKVSAVYACVRIIAGAVATLPLDIKRRVDERTRADASDTELWRLLRRRPNRWQKPAQFRRMMQAHVLLRGNAYALIVRTVKGEAQALIPLHPDRVVPRQRDDHAMEYTWTRQDGRRVVLRQDQVLHLFGLTLNGITGVTPITYARETVGLSIAMEQHGGKMFRAGARVPGYFKHPNRIGPEAVSTLKASLDDYRLGGASEGKELVLEEGMDYVRLGLSALDAQWIESRRFSRSDIAMFFGVPPHMIGDTEKSTSWGTGIEQQTQGFLAFTLEDHLTMWEEAITVDLVPEGSDLYARFNRSALVRGDIKTRWEAHARALQWGVRSPNEIRALEDENPRDGGDVFYPPPNTAGADRSENDDEPAHPA